MDRKEVIKQIGLLEANHCQECTRLTGLKQGEREDICLRNCETGKQLHELGKQLVTKPKVKKDKYSEWTSDEIKLLYSDKTTKEIAIILGRSYSSVENRRTRLRGKRSGGTSSDV